MEGQGAPIEYYRDHYRQTISTALANNVHPGTSYTVNSIGRIVQTYLTSSQRRAIDIGCGPGYILSEVKKLGFSEFGIDFNPELICIARDHYHVNAEVAGVEDLVAINAEFDLAILVHVLEHVEKPLSLLLGIRQILADKGVIFIATPNRRRSSAYGSLAKGDFGELDYPPHHLSFWSTVSLKQALRIAGYTLLECRWRPAAQGLRIERLLTDHLGLPSGPWVAVLARLIRLSIRSLKIQGEELLAVAQRR